MEHIAVTPGTVRVRDRLWGFDIRNSTLVTLVERPTGADGIVTNWALDWYDTNSIPMTGDNS